MNNTITDNIIYKLGLQPGELGFAINDFSNNVNGYQKNWTFMNLLLGFFLDKSKFMGTCRGKMETFQSFLY